MHIKIRTGKHTLIYVMHSVQCKLIRAHIDVLPSLHTTNADQNMTVGIYLSKYGKS